MGKTKILLGIVLFSIMALFGFVHFYPVRKTEISEPTGISQERETVVINYIQKYEPEEVREGGCWTTSIAAQSNPNALRCHTNDPGPVSFLYDPCFVTESNNVVCDVDPNEQGSGFLLKITDDSIVKREEIIFQEIGTGVEIQPWLIELENGLKCYTMTGTAGNIGEEMFYRFCFDGKTAIMGAPDNFVDKNKQPWEVRTANTSLEITSVKMMKVSKVWN